MVETERNWQTDLLTKANEESIFILRKAGYQYECPDRCVVFNIDALDCDDRRRYKDDFRQRVDVLVRAKFPNVGNKLKLIVQGELNSSGRETALITTLYNMNINSYKFEVVSRMHVLLSNLDLTRVLLPGEKRMKLFNKVMKTPWEREFMTGKFFPCLEAVRNLVELYYGETKSNT